MTMQEKLSMHRELENNNRQHVEDWKNEGGNTMNAVTLRTPTWTSIGKDVRECVSMEQVLQQSGLDYKVVKRPIFYGDDWQDPVGSHELINRYVTVRESDNHPYDVISDKFEIVQNRDAFDFVNYMGDEVTFEKAGETATGMVYVIAKLPEVSILGDTFTPHVIFRNGFSGKVKITAAICPLRVVCQNQFNFAFKNAENSVTIRHVQNAEQKLEEARETLRMSANYMGELQVMAEQFATTHLSEFQIQRFLQIAFPMDRIEDINPFKRARLEQARIAFIRAHDADDNANFRGTAWGLINAYTDFITHQVPQGKTNTRFEGKFMQVTFGKTMNNVLEVIGQVV